MILSYRAAAGSQRRRVSSATTANVDIELPVMSGSGGIVDRSFVVGSPPSSSGGSLGSRLFLHDGSSLVMSDDHENRSPEIGSAVSAREAFEASSGSSINGGGGTRF